MRTATITQPRVDIAIQPYFHGHGSGKQPAGVDVWFVLWDQAGRSPQWFCEHRDEVISNLDSLHVQPGYAAAFDLHRNDPRNEPFHEINFAQLEDAGETCAVHFLGAEEAYGFHLLYVRSDSGHNILNGGLFANVSGDDPPATWEAVGAEDRRDFFEVRMPAAAFRSEYAAAVERYHCEMQRHGAG